MKKAYIISLIVLGVIALVIIGGVIAVTSPKNLGVKYTDADLGSVNSKLSINYGSLAASNDPKSSINIVGKQPLDQQITESEMTALLNQPSEQWKNYPVSDIQMKINADGTVEMTGKILVNRLKAYSEARNLPDKYKRLIEDKIDLVPVNPSFYYKGNFKVVDNKLEGEMTEIKIGSMNIDKEKVSENKELINEFVEDRIASAGMEIESATFTDGKLDIKGTIPETIDFEK